MRPRTPTALRVLRGNPHKRPLNKNEPQPPILAEVPEPPEFLSPYAREHWRERAPTLHAMGLLTEVDLPAFATLCSAYGHWRLSEEALNKALCEGDGLTATGSLGNPIISPLWRASVEAARSLIRFSNEFGLTPSSRTKVTAVLPEKVSKFGGLLA